MNKKHLWIGMTVVVAAGLAWMGRAVYRARHNIVTLDVYNVPLATVIKQLARQTQETILAGNGLEARVTLAVKDVPLEEALDRLGQQAGASWSKWHAVHASDRALHQLEAALRDRTKLGDVGWTNLAPQDFPEAPNWHASAGAMDAATAGGPAPGGEGDVVVTRRKPVMVKLDSKDIKNGNVEAAVRERLQASGADESVLTQAGAAPGGTTVDVDVQATGGGSDVMVKAGGPRNRTRVITRARDGTGRMTEEIWSPEHVVLEERLHPKLGDMTYPDASELVARTVAKKVKAHLTTLYVLRKSPGGFPFTGKLLREIPREAGDGTNSAPGELPPPPDLESVVRRAEAENYTRLTPEQRVQRVREKQATNPNP
jgi:hypothetical protein